jgi:hypothetical protein
MLLRMFRSSITFKIQIIKRKALRHTCRDCCGCAYYYGKRFDSRTCYEYEGQRQEARSTNR